MAATLMAVNERAHVDLNDAELGDEPAILGATDCPFVVAEAELGKDGAVWNLTPRWLSICTTMLEKPHCGKTGVPLVAQTMATISKRWQR
jgi:hypothetical protein